MHVHLHDKPCPPTSSAGCAAPDVMKPGHEVQYAALDFVIPHHEVEYADRDLVIPHHEVEYADRDFVIPYHEVEYADRDFVIPYHEVWYRDLDLVIPYHAMSSAGHHDAGPLQVHLVRRHDRRLQVSEERRALRDLRGRVTLREGAHEVRRKLAPGNGTASSHIL